MENIKNFDLNKEVNSIEESLNLSSEIKAISVQLKINDYNSLFTFGAITSNEVSLFCDKTINALKHDNTSILSDLTDKLSSFIAKLEPSDFLPKQKNTFPVFFKKDVEIPLDELYKKYTPILLESDRIIVLIKNFQLNLNNTNAYLYELFQNSLAYYTQIRKYSKALDLFRNDIYVINNSNDNFKNMMDKKHYNLKLIENIALQQTVAIKNVISNNSSINNNMNSFYIATIPLLKQCVLNSIILKKQSIQSKSDELIKKQINEALAIDPSLSEKFKESFINQNNLDKNTILKTIDILRDGIKETSILKDLKEKDITNETAKLIKLNDEIRLKI